jgi:hypothetical protein
MMKTSYILRPLDTKRKKEAKKEKTPKLRSAPTSLVPILAERSFG